MSFGNSHGHSVAAEKAGNRFRTLLFPAQLDQEQFRIGVRQASRVHRVGSRVAVASKGTVQHLTSLNPKR